MSYTSKKFSFVNAMPDETPVGRQGFIDAAPMVGGDLIYHIALERNTGTTVPVAETLDVWGYANEQVPGTKFSDPPKVDIDTWVYLGQKSIASPRAGSVDITGMVSPYKRFWIAAAGVVAVPTSWFLVATGRKIGK